MKTQLPSNLNWSYKFQLVNFPLTLYATFSIDAFSFLVLSMNRKGIIFIILP